jgi:ABC-type lipoprotein export system ATPase subunit
VSVVLAGTELVYSVGQRTILDGISVEVTSGRVLAVRGPSGSGKSSLLAILGGLIAPSAGTVTLDDAPVSPSGGSAQRRLFGLVLQGYGLVAALTAHENVAVVLQAAGVPRTSSRTSPVASNSESRWPGRSSPRRMFCSPMNQPRSLTPRTARWSSLCWSSAHVRGPRW